MAQTTLKLTDILVNWLSNRPEQGMGYHIVDIHLKNKVNLYGRKVLNCSELIIDQSDPNFTIDDIETICNF
jgi:hypothetical protein